jgi:colanic acid biosynthesis glycosyl transferase WcaI
MRILIVGINFFPELTGIGKYTGELAAYLAAENHDVRVITAPPYYPQWQVSKPYRSWQYLHEQWEGVEVFRCPLWVPRKPSGIKRLLHLGSFVFFSFPVLLAQSTWKPEIILNIAPSIFTALPVLLLAKLCSAKSWLHIQDFEMEAAFNLGILPGSSGFQKFTAKLEMALINGFDRVSTISQRMVERLWEKGVPDDRTILFPNWIDTDLIKPLAQVNSFRTEWKISPDQFVILYSGNMGRKQGLEIILDTARLVIGTKDILFLLCGDGAEKAELQEKAKDLPNVRFFPLQPIERLNELLNLADVHVLPQRPDAADLVMPSKLSGMLASGKAVIATAALNSELGKIVNEVGKLTQPGSAKELSAAILLVKNDPTQREMMGENGRNWVINHWSKKVILSRIKQAFEGML